jgi:hypothetical protein
VVCVCGHLKQDANYFLSLFRNPLYSVSLSSLRLIISLLDSLPVQHLAEWSLRTSL